MLNYVIKCLLGLIFILFIVVVLVFLFVYMLFGDLVWLIVGFEVDVQVVVMVCQQLGFDQLLYVQFWYYIINVLCGDFGIFMVLWCFVVSEIVSCFMFMLWLMLVSMSWVVLFGMVVGIVVVVWCNCWFDCLGMVLVVSGILFLVFVFGMLLMQVFLVELGWLLMVGVDSWWYYILLLLIFGVVVVVVMVCFICVLFVDVLYEDYMCIVWVKGVSEMRVVFKYGLCNVMILVVIMMGLQFGFLFGGLIVVEKVFNWLGFGCLLVDLVEMCDYLVIQVEVLFFLLEFIFINLVVDVLYVVINLVIRYK